MLDQESKEKRLKLCGAETFVDFQAGCVSCNYDALFTRKRKSWKTVIEKVSSHVPEKGAECDEVTI